MLPDIKKIFIINNLFYDFQKKKIRNKKCKYLYYIITNIHNKYIYYNQNALNKKTHLYHNGVEDCQGFVKEFTCRIHEQEN